jgi:hypothetical protein
VDGDKLDEILKIINNTGKRITKFCIIEKEEPKKSYMIFHDFFIQELSVLLNKNDLNNVLNSTSNLKECKKKYFYWSLNHEYSYKYYNSTGGKPQGTYNYIYNDKKCLFADVFNPLMLDGNKQLSLTFKHAPKGKGGRDVRKRVDNFLDLSHLGNVHTLDITYMGFVGSFKYIENVHTLKLNHISKYYGSDNHLFDDEIQYLKNCHTLHFNHCSFNEGIKYLGNVHTIVFNSCTEITDEYIKHLEKCHTLSFDNNFHIKGEGFNNLGNVHNLYIRNWYTTQPFIPSLGNVHTLSLINVKITYEDLQHLGNVNTLKIVNGRSGRNCRRDDDPINRFTIEGLNHLKNVKNLKIGLTYGSTKVINQFIKENPTMKIRTF